MAALQIVQRGDLTPAADARRLGGRTRPDAVPAVVLRQVCGGLRRRRAPRPHPLERRCARVDGQLPPGYGWKAGPALGRGKRQLRGADRSGTRPRSTGGPSSGSPSRSTGAGRRRARSGLRQGTPRPPLGCHSRESGKPVAAAGALCDGGAPLLRLRLLGPRVRGDDRRRISFPRANCPGVLDLSKSAFASRGNEGVAGVRRTPVG